MGEIKCKICGKLKSQDYHFYTKYELCNRHYLQFRNHGKFLDDKLIINPDRAYWSDEELKTVEELYIQDIRIEDIAEKINRTYASVQHAVTKLGLPQKHMKKNNINYKAPYQEYDWCFERYINKGMSHQEMADELGVSKRVIQKWCVEIHHIDEDSYKDLKKLSDIQRQIITVGTLGDGHIDKRLNQPMYIETHAIDEKEYLFWKYEYLKDLCKKAPKYYGENYSAFSGGKLYKCKPFYRINTRIINDLKSIREMNRLDKIKQLNGFQFSLLMLDDGSRDSLWSLCVAEWTDEEVDTLYQKGITEFKIRFNRNKDKRYLSFDALSSKRIDEMILQNIPNELDIIKKKIINNPKIRELQNAHYVLTNNGRIGIATYSKKNKIPYNVIKNVVWNMDLPFNEISEQQLLSLPEVSKYAIQQLSSP